MSIHTYITYMNELKFKIQTISERCDYLEQLQEDLKTENMELYTKISILSKNMETIIQLFQSKKESMVSDYKYDKFELQERIPKIIPDGVIKAFTKGKENNFALGTNQGWIHTYSFDNSSQKIIQQNKKQLLSKENIKSNCDITYLTSYQGGEQLIVCSKYSPISILDWNNLEIIKQFNEQKEDVNFLLDLGNDKLASGGNDKKIKIWDINQEKNIDTIEINDKNKLKCRSMIKLTNHNGFIVSVRSLAGSKLFYFDKVQNKDKYNCKSKLDGVGTQFNGGLVEISEQRFAVASGEDTIVIVKVDKNKGTMTKEQEIKDQSISTEGTAFTFCKYKNNLFYASDGYLGKIKISEANESFSPYCIMEKCRAEFGGVLLLLFNRYCIADNNEQGLTIFSTS